MSRADLYLVVAAVIAALGMVRMLTTGDLLRRLIALNVASGGTLMVLLAFAARSGSPDPVPHALALTGIVITVSLTGLALVLIRRIEADEAQREGSDESAAPP